MSDFQLGRHDAAIQQLQEDMNEVKSDMKTVLGILDRRQGERRANAKISAGFGIVGGSGVTLLARIVMAKMGIHG